MPNRLPVVDSFRHSEFSSTSDAGKRVVFQRSVALTPFNTFGIEVRATYFSEVTAAAQLPQLAGRLPALPLLILGGGSNLLFTRDHPGTVLLNRITGMEVVTEDEGHITLRCGAGETWDGVAARAAAEGWWGPENLSLIPGTVGGAAVQNIGAYGAELAPLVVSVEGIHLDSGREETLPRHACRFGYRTSLFKSPAYRNFFITGVTFLFSKKGKPNLDYPALRECFAAPPATPQEVREAVITLRRSKLPDPTRTGNAGSFFKNPVIDESQLRQLRRRHPTLPAHPAGEGQWKIPAAWLIEQCGWKGKRRGDAATWPRQPLVLVNHGTATGQDIDNLGKEIAASVKKRFDISLEREVITL